jgi:hypothetical protein
MTSTTSTTTTRPVTSITSADTKTLTIGKTGPLNFNGIEFANLFDLPIELIQSIALYCLSSRDLKGVNDVINLKRTNYYCYVNLSKLLNKQNITQLCPELTIRDIHDLKAQGFTDLTEEPPLDLFKVFKSYWELIPFVEMKKTTEGEKSWGLTVLTIPQDLTLNKLKEAAKGTNDEEKVEIEIYDAAILTEHGTVAEGETCQVMLSNAPVTGTRNKTNEDQIGRVIEVGFDGLPTMKQKVLLIVTTQKASKKAICLYGQDPWTYGRSSTLLNAKWPLVIGGSAAGCVGVCTLHNFGDASLGAGGLRKF